MPLAAMTQAASRANSAEWFRQSKQMATPSAQAWRPLPPGRRLGKGLGSMADDMDVHLVQAGTHGAPQASGAEGKLVKEAAFDLLGVIALMDSSSAFSAGERAGLWSHFLITYSK